MARQKSYDSSESEQRYLAALMQQGKALPEKYRFILFEDKRKVEWVWKNRDGIVSKVCLTQGSGMTQLKMPQPAWATQHTKHQAFTHDLIMVIMGHELDGLSQDRAAL